MKSIIKPAVVLLAMSVSLNQVWAQDEKNKMKGPEKEKSGDLIIRKKGNSNEKMTIVIDGDKVTINGKPVDEFKSDELDIITGDDMHWRMPGGAMAYTAPGPGVHGFNIMGDDFMKEIHSNKAFLGVMTKKTEKGAEITEVTEGSAAEKAGLKEGDIITKVNDTKIEDADDLYKAIGEQKPDDKVKIGILRDGKATTVDATLTENKQVRVFSWKNGDDDIKMRTPAPPGGFRWKMDDDVDFWNEKPRLGVQVQDTEDGKGVKVLDVDEDEAAGKAGLKEDDIITTFNGKYVTSVDDIKSNMKNIKKGDSVTIGYKRNNKPMSATVKFPKELKTTDL